MFLFVILTSLFQVPGARPQEDGVRKNWRNLRRHCLEDIYYLGAHFVSAWPQCSQLFLVSLVLKYIEFRMNSISSWGLWPEDWSQLQLAAM